MNITKKGTDFLHLPTSRMAKAGGGGVTRGLTPSPPCQKNYTNLLRIALLQFLQIPFIKILFLDHLDFKLHLSFKIAGLFQ